MTYTDDREERIRVKAFYIWLDEGSPDGRAEAHWDMAAELVAIEDNYRDTFKPIGEAGEPVEPMLAVENAGEFPTLRDQGEETIRPLGRKTEETPREQPLASSGIAKTVRPKSQRA
jgi:Protein of unknown function (DUF2934)